MNDAGAELVRGHPGRFGYFATLPIPDIAASLAEMRRAFDELGADGVVLQTNTDGTYLGSPLFAPILAELNRRKATLFLHPTSPACFEALGLGRPAPLLEFPLDTTRTIVDLLYARSLQTNPDIKVIVPHGGAALPALIARIAAFANLPIIEPRPASEAEVFETLERLYYDVALSAHPVPFAALRRIAPITQILFGSDWPFTPEAGVARNIHQLGQRTASARTRPAPSPATTPSACFPDWRRHKEPPDGLAATDPTIPTRPTSRIATRSSCSTPARSS